MTDGELKLKNRYRFTAQDAEVGAAFLYNDVLRATISVAGLDSYMGTEERIQSAQLFFQDRFQEMWYKLYSESE